MDLFDLTGKVAIVTGGNSGIGLGMARGLIAAGATVAIAARTVERSRTAAAELDATGTHAFAVPCDVADAASIAAMVEAVLARAGRIDILVNNAGTTVRKRPELLTQEEWRTVLETNLDGAFLCSQACYPAMQAAGGGKVLNNGSMLSIFGSPWAAAYAASKGGIVQLTKSLAAAWAADNIQVNFPPGWIDTPLTVGARAEVPGLCREGAAHARRCGATSTTFRGWPSSWPVTFNFITGAVSHRGRRLPRQTWSSRTRSDVGGVAGRRCPASVRVDAAHEGVADGVSAVAEPEVNSLRCWPTRNPRRRGQPLCPLQARAGLQEASGDAVTPCCWLSERAVDGDGCRARPPAALRGAAASWRRRPPGHPPGASQTGRVILSEAGNPRVTAAFEEERMKTGARDRCRQRSISSCSTASRSAGPARCTTNLPSAGAGLGGGRGAYCVDHNGAEAQGNPRFHRDPLVGEQVIAC
ncbi:MAG: SDR family NAD(P)-dependent oxidoreductase [Caldilineaceae bacterium]